MHGVSYEFVTRYEVHNGKTVVEWKYIEVDTMLFSDKFFRQVPLFQIDGVKIDGNFISDDDISRVFVQFVTR